MSEIDKHIGFVNNQAAFHERQAERFSSDIRRVELHNSTVEKFNQLAAFLESQRQKIEADEPLRSSGVERLSLSWDEIEGLPEELLSELSISQSDKFDFHIVAAVDEAGGIASLDRLLVSLFKSTGEIIKREKLNSRIYRLIQKDMLYSVPGKKGVYSTRPIEEEVAVELN